MCLNEGGGKSQQLKICKMCYVKMRRKLNKLKLKTKFGGCKNVISNEMWITFNTVMYFPSSIKSRRKGSFCGWRVLFL